MSQRQATVTRKTGETSVTVSLNLDGAGRYQVKSGNGMLDHLVSQISRHSLMDISLEASRDPSGWHHLVEDAGIALGRAFRQALGDGRGIRRMGHALVPMDEALAMVAVDLGGRSYAVVDVKWAQENVEDLPGDLVRHFLEAFSNEARITLHARLLSGSNAHHQAEALFKALAKALRQALELDPRLGEDVPSTKGTISG